MPDHDKTFGASGTPLSSLSGGALRALGGRENIKTAEEIARALSPQPQPIDPALLSFLFFTNLAAESSKPGATALGAAGTAALTPAKYLMQQREQQRKAEEQLPQTALNIAKLIKPAAGTGRGEKYVKTEPVLGEDGLIKRIEGAPVYTYRVEDKKGNLIRTVEMPDLSSAASIKPVKFFNEEGKAKFFTPGSQEYNQALGGEGDYIYAEVPKPSSTSTKLTPYNITEDRTIDGIFYPAGSTAFLTNAEALDNRGVLTKSTDGAIKTVGDGTQALLMSEEDAKTFVRSQGISEDNENYDQYVNMLTAPSDDLIGQPLVRGDSFTKIVPLQIGNKVSALQFSPLSGQTPGFVKFRNKRLEILAKNKDTHLDNISQSIPRIETAMGTLLSGDVQTGMLTEFTLPVKRFLAQAFGTDAAAITALDDLQAISFYLAPKMRPVGSGSTSDLEFKAYQRAILDLGKTSAANYISLYAMKKMMEKGAELKLLEEELLTSGRISNTTELNAELRAIDKGIFEKYEGDPNDQEEFDNWYNSLPNGAVIVNNGLEAFGDTPYLIKGWQGD